MKTHNAMNISINQYDDTEYYTCIYDSDKGRSWALRLEFSDRPSNHEGL